MSVLSRPRFTRWSRSGARWAEGTATLARSPFGAAISSDDTEVDSARLHNLLPAFASHAVMIGESQHVVGRLLGHRRGSTTERYVNLDNATLSQAAERLAAAVERKLRGFGFIG